MKLTEPQLSTLLQGLIGLACFYIGGFIFGAMVALLFLVLKVMFT